MKITKSQLENIIREELALVKEAGDPVGPVEAQKMAELLQNLGFTLTRGGLNSFIEFLEGLESRGDLNATPDTRRGALAELALVKEDWVDELYNALYALEDKVEGVVVDTELEQVYRKFHSMLKAHILEKSKVRDAARKEGGAMEEAAPAPGSQAFPRGLAPELDKSPEGQAKLAAKQEYDALTTMITRLDGMESFLLNTTRQKSDEALTQQAAEQLNALHATLSQLRKGL